MAKKKKVVVPGIPKDLRRSVVRKFKSKDRKKRYLVMRRPADGGFDVQTFSKKGGLSLVRAFTMPAGQSEIPTPILLSVELELAVWYARHVARKGIAPNVKRERSRRRRYTKRALSGFVKHVETKKVVDELKERPRPPKLKRPQILLPFICLYDPKARKEDPVFHVHTAYCPLLDQQRKRMVKRGGTSWVIEAVTAAGAVVLQLAEFNDDDKGYDRDDFKIHKCGDGERILKAKRRKRGVEQKKGDSSNAGQGATDDKGGSVPEGDPEPNERGYLLKSEVGVGGN